MTIRKEFAEKIESIEKYARQGMTVAQIADKIDVPKKRLTDALNIYKISVVRLRNEGAKTGSCDA